LLEAGALDGAEAALREALALLGEAEDDERLGDEPAAKARYWMGELWRARFRAAPLDLGLPEAALAEALERKSQLLLAAQGQYLRAARRGSPGYGVAGLRWIGELYEELHAELSAAPPPPGATAAEAAAWRAALDEELGVLVQKAVAAYEEALAAARARRLDADYVEAARRGLERMKALSLSRQGR
jgi:hypothetical protein